MSEFAPSRHEKHSDSDVGEVLSRQHESIKESIEKAKNAKHEHAEKLEEIRTTIEQKATPAEKITEHTNEHEPKEVEPSLHINRELKAMAYQRTLKRARRQLPVRSRALSKVVHQPTIESISELAGKTIARPSGILAGGIVAFIGSSLFLWIARHYGYEYNFLLFALLFVGGFFIGLLIELVMQFGARHR
jgi:hypothetical protein